MNILTRNGERIGIILFEIKDWKKENIHGKKGDFLIRNKGKNN